MCRCVWTAFGLNQQPALPETLDSKLGVIAREVKVFVVICLETIKELEVTNGVLTVS